MSEPYNRDRHQAEVEKFFDRPSPKVETLGEALYAMDELGLWPDSVDSVSREQAITCWKLVEALREKPFPRELKM